MYPATVWVFSIIKLQYQLIEFKIIPNPFCKIWIRHAVTFKVSGLSMTMLTPIGTTHCLIQVWATIARVYCNNSKFIPDWLKNMNRKMSHIHQMFKILWSIIYTSPFSSRGFCQLSQTEIF